jgi:hypothetical protein
MQLRCPRGFSWQPSHHPMPPLPSMQLREGLIAGRQEGQPLERAAHVDAMHGLGADSRRSARRRSLARAVSGGTRTSAWASRPPRRPLRVRMRHPECCREWALRSRGGRSTSVCFAQQSAAQTCQARNRVGNSPECNGARQQAVQDVQDVQAEQNIAVRNSFWRHSNCGTWRHGLLTRRS